MGAVQKFYLAFYWCGPAFVFFKFVVGIGVTTSFAVQKKNVMQISWLHIEYAAS